MNIRRYVYCILGTGLILIDRISKIWAKNCLSSNQEVTAWFSLERVHNSGVSFGFFADHGFVTFWFLTILISVLLDFF